MSPLSRCKSWTQVQDDSSKHWEPTPYAGKHLKLPLTVIEWRELKWKQQQQQQTASEKCSPAITFHMGLKNSSRKWDPAVQLSPSSKEMQTHTLSTTRLLKLPSCFPWFVHSMGQKRACCSLAMEWMQNCRLVDVPQGNWNSLFSLETSMVMRTWETWFGILDLGLESVQMLRG